MSAVHSFSVDFRSFVFILLYVLLAHGSSPWIDYPPSGTATMTHYQMPVGFIAACGCIAGSTNYPTAALSQMAYGSSTSYGPSCGRCFQLTLLNTYLPTPPFFPPVTKSVVVKVTDLCPLSANGWCSGTQTKKNPGGQYLNFDLVYPSAAIPSDFFPSNEPLYGYTDFGVWNITYQSVDCSQWAGGHDTSALGSAAALQSNGCCPANPTGSSNNTCPSYSDNNGIPPNTIISTGGATLTKPVIPAVTFTLLILFHTLCL